MFTSLRELSDALKGVAAILTDRVTVSGTPSAELIDRLAHTAVFAADAEVDLADRHRPAGRAEQPALDQLGPGVRVPNQPARRVKHARHHDFAIALRVSNVIPDVALGCSPLVHFARQVPIL